MFGLETLWCVIAHDYEKTAESVRHTYHKCSRCGYFRRFRKPQPPEPYEPEIRTTPSGHEYEMGVAHDCGEPDCPANLPTQ